VSFAEPEELAILRAQGGGVGEVARRLGRSPSTTSRELRRNAATRGGSLAYRATTAQWHADRRASRPKVAKLAANDALSKYVQDRLGAWSRPLLARLCLVRRCAGLAVGTGAARTVVGRVVEPAAGSEQTSGGLPRGWSMRLSHEATYQALYLQGRGALRRELTACLRTGRALRVPRARTRGRGKRFVSPEVMLGERPAEVDDRAVPGHWQGDLILGLGSSAVGTLVERTSRFTMVLHLPRMEGHRDGSGSRTALRWLGTVRRRFATRSPRRSRRCPSSCAGR
jgi:IS30 family transposase